MQEIFIHTSSNRYIFQSSNKENDVFSSIGTYTKEKTFPTSVEASTTEVAYKSSIELLTQEKATSSIKATTNEMIDSSTTMEIMNLIIHMTNMPMASNSQCIKYFI